jgi:hypothetical protein
LTSGVCIRATAPWLVAALAVCGCLASVGTAAAQSATNEYDLNLPAPSGGSVDPSARADDGDDSADEPEATEAAQPVVTTPAVDPESTNTPAPASPNEAKRERNDPPRGPEYPRGRTFALGPVDETPAKQAGASSGDDGDWGVLAAVAGAAALLCAAAAWRLRGRGGPQE